MRLAFFGSGGFGLPTLESLTTQHQVVAVVTQPDRPAGRKRKLTATPIGQRATEQGLSVFKADNVNDDDFVDSIRTLDLDASIVIAFGQKLGEPIIDAMGTLAVNLHGSLLPAYRGAAPIQRAVMAGDSATGVSVIALAQRMDAGDVYKTASLDIKPDETSGMLHDRLAMLGPTVMRELLDDFANDTLSPTPQDESLATRAPKLTKADAWVDFAMPAAAVRARINGLNPWPGCKAHWLRPQSGSDTNGNAGGDIKLIRCVDVDVPSSDAEPGTIIDAQGHVSCGKGVVRLLEVQVAGGRAMAFADFARGHGDMTGHRLHGMRTE